MQRKHHGSIINTSDIIYVEGENSDAETTAIQNSCVLDITFSEDFAGIPIRPGEILNYNIGATCRDSRLYNPIIGFLIPSQLEYLGNEVLSYYDNAKDAQEPTLPEPEIFENINDNGDSMVVFKFKDEYSFDFRQKSTFDISFDTTVKIGATGTFETFAILNVLDSTQYIDATSKTYIDTNNLAGDTSVSDEYEKSSIISNQILLFVATKSNKKVKGMLDTEYLEEPAVGSTLAGGSIEYKISITNIGNVELEQVEIVDILPHIGDTGVIVTSSERLSDFPIYSLEEVKAQIIGEDGTVVETGFDIYYSNSYDPVRFGPAFDEIGTDDNWQTEMFEDITSLKSIKVIASENKLYPNEVLEITIIAIAPTGTPTKSVAWNTFAADAVYTNSSGVKTYMLAIEPEKVGIQIFDTPDGKAKITGKTWFDTNKDGYPDDTEDGINDVGIIIVDETGTIINYAFTAPNYDGDDGYYSFDNLEYGTYTLMFYKDDKYIFTVINDAEEGNKVNSTTNTKTDIELNELLSIITINGGLINKPTISISKLLEVNESVNQTFKNVIRNQMLITMKTEDTIKLIEYENDKNND